MSWIRRSRTAPRVRFAFCLALSLLFLASTRIRAQDTDAQRTVQETLTKSRLEKIRAQIRDLSEAQKATSTQKNDAAAALREQELKVTATARELRVFEQKLTAQQAELDQLQARRGALNIELGTQRDALAALVRSAYAMGRNEELKLLLAQDDSAAAGRLLTYYRYFEKARVGEIAHLLDALHELAQVQARIEQETVELNRSREQRAAQARLLDAERSERQRVLASLDATLKDQQSRLAALGHDEKDLLELLEKLRDVFADIPKQIAGAEPFAQLRGRLSWPLRGKTQSLADAGHEGEHEGHGLMIAAAEGSEIHAVSHGRVVFADWLRGFGLLLIVDHGDGYLSLYGCNETLLKDVGDWVNTNEVIASSGASGGRKTPGLYFELRHEGKPIDVAGWLKPASR